MSGENRAGVGLRITQVAARTGLPGDDLVSFNTAEYPDGALCLVASELSIYALDKGSTLTPDGTAVVAAIGGGNWIALSSVETTLFSAAVQWTVTAGSSTGALTNNTWTALPSGANNFQDGGNSTLWSLNTTSGVLTYSGPTKNFLLIAHMCGVADNGAATNFEFSFSRSNLAIIGGTTDPLVSAQIETVATNDETNWSIVGPVTSLGSAQTIQGCLRNKSGTDDLVILRYNLALIPFS